MYLVIVGVLMSAIIISLVISVESKQERREAWNLGLISLLATTLVIAINSDTSSSTLSLAFHIFGVSLLACCLALSLIRQFRLRQRSLTMR